MTKTESLLKRIESELGEVERLREENRKLREELKTRPRSQDYALLREENERLSAQLTQTRFVFQQELVDLQQHIANIQVN